MTTEITHTPASLATLDTRDAARVAESLVTRGDISGLTSAERVRLYTAVCEGLGLNPTSQPFAFLKLNGKEVMYATRGATDQLAAMARLTREIIDGPKVIDLAGTKLVYAQARATHPNGRTETAVATIPLTDPANVMMKCETKAKRRVTLSILGLGLLDEMELETIPASVKAPADAAPGLPMLPSREPGEDDDAPAPVEGNAATSPAQPAAWSTFLAVLDATRLVVEAWKAYWILQSGLRAEQIDPIRWLNGPGGAAVIVARKLRALGLVLSTTETNTLLGCPEATLAEALDGVLVVPLRDAKAAAKCWLDIRGKLAQDRAAVVYMALARRVAGSAEPNGKATKEGKDAIAAAVEQLAPKPPSGPGGGAPKPTNGAPASAEGSAAPAASPAPAPLAQVVSLRGRVARPGEVVTTAGEILSTASQFAAHLASLDHPRAVEASYAAHPVPLYRALAVERYVALVGCDERCARAALDGAAYRAESRQGRQATTARRAVGQ